MKQSVCCNTGPRAAKAMRRCSVADWGVDEPIRLCRDHPRRRQRHAHEIRDAQGYASDCRPADDRASARRAEAAGAGGDRRCDRAADGNRRPLCRTGRERRTGPAARHRRRRAHGSCGTCRPPRARGIDQRRARAVRRHAAVAQRDHGAAAEGAAASAGRGPLGRDAAGRSRPLRPAGCGAGRHHPAHRRGRRRRSGGAQHRARAGAA